MQPQPPANHPLWYKKWITANAVLAALGLLVSTYLVRLHYLAHTDPEHVSICAINEGMNCDTVALSDHSILLGLPLAWWGVLFFSGLLVLLLNARKREHTSWPVGALSLLNLVGLGISAYLLLVSEHLIHSLCIMCISIYTINLLMGGTCLAAQRRLGCSLWPGATLAATALLGGAWLFANIHQAHLTTSWQLLKLGAPTLLLGTGLLCCGRSTTRKTVSRTLGLMVEDIRQALAQPVFPFGLAGAGLAAWIGLVLVLPLFYGQPLTSPDQLRISEGPDHLAVGQTSEGFHWIGSLQPKMVITEYSDYRCPYCRKAHQVVREIVREHGDEVRLVHVQMPLDSTCNQMLQRPFHPKACDCALAAICAGEQGKFWDMNDRLFSCSQEPSTTDLDLLAPSLGLDLDTFKSCMVSDRARQKLDANLAACKQKGLRPATPTFVLGKQTILGLKNKEWWRRAITQSIAQPES